MFNSNQIDRAQVDRFKEAIRPTLKFPAGKLELYALAEALEELAAEFRKDAAQMR
jgi:hypothetical protein